MVTWANQLQGMTQLTTMREVRKQLNNLTSKEVELVHFKFSVIFILALCVLIYLMLHAQFEWRPYRKYGKEFLKHVSKADKALFTIDSPFISYWVLELTLPLGL